MSEASGGWVKIDATRDEDTVFVDLTSYLNGLLTDKAEAPR
jgi:hypothetical protein